MVIKRMRKQCVQGAHFPPPSFAPGREANYNASPRDANCMLKRVAVLVLMCCFHRCESESDFVNTVHVASIRMRTTVSSH